MQSVPKIVRERLRAAPPALDHPDADLLTAFAERSLPMAERATVLEHLARCGDCRDVVALALPPTEMLETAVPLRTSWLTWPALRWGFVAAGVVIVASLGFLQLQKHSETSRIAGFSSPKSQVASNEAHPQLTVATPTVPAAKQDTGAGTSDRIDERSKATKVAAEGKAPAAVAPPASSRAQSFHSSGNGASGGVFGGPRPPSQFLVNNNVQQQSFNSAPAPAPRLPGLNSPSARQSAGANEVVSMGGPTSATDNEGTRSEAQLRNPSSDSQQLVDKTSVSKSKPPTTQPTVGLIAGRVMDSSGAAVPNARITVTPATEGQSASAVTDSQGAFLIAGISTGNYKAQAQAPGFNTTTEDFSYDASRPSAYNFILNVGSESESVEVSAQTAQLQTLPATAGGSLNIYGRNYTALASVSPGPMPRWSVSASGALQRSFDQGKSWQSVNVNVGPPSSASVEIARESRAKEVSKEKDGDKKRFKLEGASPVFRAVTAAGLDVWAGGSSGALYHSVDAGNHWSKVIPTASGTTLAGDIISLEFSDAQNGKITTSTPEIWTTGDAGQTWQKQQ